MQIFNDSRDVFFNRRFGMFIHWGLYAISAWHEQILWKGKMKRKDYEKLIHSFNPIEFNPDEWIDIAQSSGMQYICFTTKHHDGFCMWDTAYTNYNIMNTPYKKDILSMLAEACHKRNFPLSLYYSCPDWYHRNYPNMGRHHEMFGQRQGDEPDIEKYYDYVRNQIIELCTNYGKIYQFFWDVNVAEYHDPSINEMIRQLQPGILINDRGPGKGDYNTPERRIPDGMEFHTPTEACQSLGSESWGYKEDEDYYSYKYIIQSINRILAMGGNYLLNVGPRADGIIAPQNVKALERIGKWYKEVREAFDGTILVTGMLDPDISEGNVLLTRKGNVIYIHVYSDPQKDAVLLKPLDILPQRAILLNNGMELEARVDVTPCQWRNKSYLRIRKLPVNEMNDEAMVIKLEFDESVNE